MANVTRTTKRIIDPATGIVREVEVEILNDETVKRFEIAAQVQARMGFNLDSRNASVIGSGKHTGKMSKANAAKEYKGTATRKEWKRRIRHRHAQELAKSID